MRTSSEQVRDAEFNREIERRGFFAEQREQAVALAGLREDAWEARDEIASRDAEIAKLTQNLAAIKRENDAARAGAGRADCGTLQSYREQRRRNRRAQVEACATC